MPVKNQWLLYEPEDNSYNCMLNTMEDSGLSWIFFVFKMNFYKIRKKSARRVVLLTEMLIVSIVAFIPQGEIQNTLANALVSFMAAMQMEAFKVFSGQVITTTVSTGNFRKFIEGLYQGIREHDHQTRRVAYQYALIVIFFIFGGWTGMKFANYAGIKSVLFELIWLFIVFVIITIKAEYLNHSKD